MKRLCPFACIAACLLSTACANPGSEAPEQGLSAELAAEIEGICGLPAGALSRQTPVPDDAMPKLACAVTEARKRNVAFDFVSYPADPDS